MRRHHGRLLSPYAGRTAAPLSADVTLVRNFDSHVNPSRPARQSPLATSQIQGMPLDLIERMRLFPLFQTTPDTFLIEVGTLLKPQMHAPNDSIMTEGEEAKAMYWIVRGAVAVTSRDGESTYAELKSGAFVGEIGILLERPRTASVVARTRCLTLQLKKEDLQKILPRYPDVERAIREEALERLSILEKKKRQQLKGQGLLGSKRRGSKRPLDAVGDAMELDHGPAKLTAASKRRKSPSPGLADVSAASALGNGLVNVRGLLKELPLFAGLPHEILHFLGLNALPQTFPPFTEIIKQGTSGREVFFIVRGEVEVLDETSSSSPPRRRGLRRKSLPRTPAVKARLRSGQYFGEVASLLLADHRTATVRSVTQVECLVITELVLAEFWKRCPPDVREQIEGTARQRLETASLNEVIMDDADSTPDIDELVIGDNRAIETLNVKTPKITFRDPAASRRYEPAKEDDLLDLHPLDPDPFSSAGLEKVRMRSRRSSLAPPSPSTDPNAQSQASRRSSKDSIASSPMPASPPSSRGSPSDPASPISDKPPTFIFSDPFVSTAPPRPKAHRVLGENRGTIPEQLLPLIFAHLDLQELMRLQAVSAHWQHILTKSPLLFHTLDLSQYNRKLSDHLLINRICPFVGQRPRVIDISNCFHITDNGFNFLASSCGANCEVWRMKSVWDVTASAILEMSNVAKGLRELDLSNCRKVSDTLLARIVGWVVPNSSPTSGHGPGSSTATQTLGRSRLGSDYRRIAPASPLNHESGGQAKGLGLSQGPAPGTTFGNPNLTRLTLSYCKHVTDRTMHYIATHAAKRIEAMDLTRCTTITDLGFQYWGNVRFENLKRLCLADCTYLSDQAMVWLVNGAGPSLRELNLSFCCALSDTSTEVLALGCPELASLDMSFCGSAVSDGSLRSIGHHLTKLQRLAVRGCVRVTGVGVDSVVEGCTRLQYFDVSQCKNLLPWIEMGGVERWREQGRHVDFEMMK